MDCQWKTGRESPAGRTGPVRRSASQNAPQPFPRRGEPPRPTETPGSGTESRATAKDHRRPAGQGAPASCRARSPGVSPGRSSRAKVPSSQSMRLAKLLPSSIRLVSWLLFPGSWLQAGGLRHKDHRRPAGSHGSFLKNQCPPQSIPPAFSSPPCCFFPLPPPKIFSTVRPIRSRGRSRRCMSGVCAGLPRTRTTKGVGRGPELRSLCQEHP